MELIPKILFGSMIVCVLVMIFCGMQIIISNRRINKIDAEIMELEIKHRSAKSEKIN